MARRSDIRLLVQAEVNRALAELEKVDKQLDDTAKSGKSLNSVFAAGGKLFGGLFSAYALKEAAQMGLELDRLAKEAADVSAAFNRLPDSNRLLQQLRENVRGTVPDVELMRAALSGIDLGGTNEQLATFAEFARFESVRKGSDTLQTFQNILGGVFRGSTELLDNFGFSLAAVNGRIEELAVAQGKNANALTSVERRGLLAEAVLQLMNERLEEQGELATSDAEKLRQTTAAVENFWVRVGQGLSSVGGAFNDFFNESIVALNKFLDLLGVGGAARLEELAGQVVALRKSTASQAQSIEGFLAEYEDLQGQSDRTAEQQARLNEVIAALADKVPGAVSAIDDYGRAIGINTNAVNDFLRAQRELLKRTEDDVFEDVKASAAKAVKDMGLLQKAIETTSAEIDRLSEKDPGEIVGNDARDSMSQFGRITITAAERAKNLRDANKENEDTAEALGAELDSLIDALTSFIDLANITPQALSAELGESEQLATVLINRFKELAAARRDLNTDKPAPSPTGDDPASVQKQITALRLKARLDALELDSALDKYEKEKEAVRLRYAAEIDAARNKGTEVVRLLEEERDRQLAIITQRQTEELQEKIDSVRLKLEQDEIELSGTLDKYDRMREAAKARYAEEIRLARETSAELAALREKELALELAKIDRAEAEDTRALTVDISLKGDDQALLAQLQEGLNAINAFYAEKIRLAGESENLIAQLEAERAEKTKALMDEVTAELTERYLLRNQAVLDSFSVLEAGYDTFLANVLDKEMSGAEKREAIWQSVSQAWVQLLGDMLRNFIQHQLRELLQVEATEEAKNAIRQSATAQKVALDATSVSSSQAVAAAQTDEAATGFFAAHSKIPFVGFAIAAAFVAAMLAKLASIKGKATGGLVRSGDLVNLFTPSGEDGLSGLQVGEYVMPRQQTAKYRPLLDAMREDRLSLPVLNAPLPAASRIGGASSTSTVERIIERVLPIAAGVTVETVEAPLARTRDHYIRVNRDILRRDNAFVDQYLQTDDDGEFDA